MTMQAETNPIQLMSNQLVIANAVQSILGSIGENPNREGLLETPDRVARAYAELCEGYHMDPMDALKTFEVAQSDAMVLVKHIPFFSLCEHHMLPFYGQVDVGYIPEERVLGLSKFARIVEIFSRRLQVQERLTGQIADCLYSGLKAKGVMVVISASHMCMAMRGVEAVGSITTTSAVRGVFLDRPAARTEFLELRKGV